MNTWVCNVIAVPNPTQDAKLDIYSLLLIAYSLLAVPYCCIWSQNEVSAVALDRSLAMRVDRSFIDKLSKDLPHLEKSIEKVRITIGHQ